MLPSSSLDLASPWQCLGVAARGSGCGAVMEADAVARLEEKVEKALEEVRIWLETWLRLRGGPDVEHLAELFLALMEDEGVMMR